MLKKIICIIFCSTFFLMNTIAAEIRKDIEVVSNGVTMQLNSYSACLMEASSGEILYEQNSETHLEPASVTKIMSILIFMEEIDNGNLKLEDMVVGSMNASKMGGSQIWLEYGEEFTVNDMLKAVIVVSANDCTVALAEHISGSEEAFVVKMNEKAKELGMTNTNFMNCTGLPVEGHYTCANDIAVMTKELLKHQLVFNYTSIWMDSLRGGQSGLTNTNKLIRFYKGANGMKTGFTSSAQYCLSGTANREGMQLIAAVMKAPTSDQRFEDAKKLLDYGFANFAVYKIDDEQLPPIKIVGGTEEFMDVSFDIKEILLAKGKEKKVEKIVETEKELFAPIKKGQKVGTIRFASMGEEIAIIDITAVKNVKRIEYKGIFEKVFKKLIMFS